MKVCQAYKFALAPAPAQERALRSHAGAARFAWNWGLAKCRERYEAEGKWYSGAELHKLWNTDKKADPGLAWWRENSKCACQEAFRNLDRALRDFGQSGKGERKGKRPGFPKFKKRGKCRDSFRFGAGVMRCSGTTVTLPRLGTVRTHESTRKLTRRLENGTARICPRPSHGPLSGGSCRSRSKPGGTCRSRMPGPGRPWVSTSALRPC